MDTDVAYVNGTPDIALITGNEPNDKRCAFALLPPAGALGRAAGTQPASDPIICTDVAPPAGKQQSQ
ncbi:hypothetical protein GCM10027217_06630 [Pseudomaricurvus hydrocarbonicus]